MNLKNYLKKIGYAFDLANQQFSEDMRPIREYRLKSLGEKFPYLARAVANYPVAFGAGFFFEGEIGLGG